MTCEVKHRCLGALVNAVQWQRPYGNKSGVDFVNTVILKKKSSKNFKAQELVIIKGKRN